MRKRIIAQTAAILLVVLFSFSAYAQTPADPNALGFKVLFLDYYTPNPGETAALDNISTGYEVSYLRSINQYLDLAIPIRFGVIDFQNDIDNHSIVGVDGVFKVKYYREGLPVTPYLYAGGGYVIENMENGHFQAPAGLGVNFNIWERAFINAQAGYRYSPIEDRNALELGIGFIMGIGKKGPKDSDKDGIPDDIDKCPDQVGSQLAMGCPDLDNDGVSDALDECPTEAGAVNGCPDRDEDGIADKDDECPDDAGIVENNGCPEAEDAKEDMMDGEDKKDMEGGMTDGSGTGTEEPMMDKADGDGDGVSDDMDECPTEAGTLATKGCPDRDGDGIADKNDPCPYETGPNGCPDRDGDGVADKDDRCPGLSGSIAAGGCPDTDNDGVPDPSDKCPATFGPASNFGCPELRSDERDVLNLATEAVQFDNNRASIKSSSYSVLNQIADIMLKYPGYKVSIAGHTDIIGGTRHNQVLSEKRAKACYDYLVSRGVDSSRVSYIGYGVTQPIATNKTAEGRRLNRRVEFNLYVN